MVPSLWGANSLQLLSLPLCLCLCLSLRFCLCLTLPQPLSLCLCHSRSVTLSLPLCLCRILTLPLYLCLCHLLLQLTRFHLSAGLLDMGLADPRTLCWLHAAGASDRVPLSPCLILAALTATYHRSEPTIFPIHKTPTSTIYATELFTWTTSAKRSHSSNLGSDFSRSFFSLATLDI